MKVRLFSSCLTDVHYPGVKTAARGVLKSLGVESEPLSGVTCCGQAFFNSGHPDLARKVGQRLFASIIESNVPVVMTSGSCAFFVRKRYPEMFGPEVNLDERCFEFTEFISRNLGADIKGTLTKPLRAAYHPSCHMLRGIGLVEEPFEILLGIENLELVRIGKEKNCCGFGGIFSAVYPKVSDRMSTEKVMASRDAGASAVISADAGCMRRIERSGMHPVHIAELLQEALER